MKILAQIDTSRDGNDYYHYEVWSLVEVFGSIIGIRVYRYSDWSEQTTSVQEYTMSEMDIDHREILEKLMDLL